MAFQKTPPNPPANPEAVRTNSQRVTAPREREALFGGPQLKLRVRGEVEGHHLFWENDQNGAVEDRLAEGFTFVTPDEVDAVRHTVVVDGDLANRVSRVVGSDGGTPIRAYLLKIPEDMWQERQRAFQRLADEREGEIRTGAIQQGGGHYVPKSHRSEIDTNFQKSY